MKILLPGQQERSGVRATAQLFAVMTQRCSLTWLQKRAQR